MARITEQELRRYDTPEKLLEWIGQRWPGLLDKVKEVILENNITGDAFLEASKDDWQALGLAKWAALAFVQEARMIKESAAAATPVFGTPVGSYGGDEQAMRRWQDDVLGICYEFWHDSEGAIPSMPNEADFKRVYPRSATEICRIQGRPVLLLQGLKEGHHFDSSGKVLQQIQASGCRLCFLVDASGSGKTRTLYEMACRTHSIYLTGVADSGLGDEGSRDLDYVARKLQAMYPDCGEVIPDEALEVCMAAVFIARLFVLQEVRHAGVDISPFNWLFNQVYFKHLNYHVPDPWMWLTRRILDVLVPDRCSTSYLRDVQTVFLRCLWQLKANLNWSGLVVLDEAQELAGVLENRFRNKNDQPRSMLDKMFLALDSIGFGSRVIFSGTGRHLIRMQSSRAETVKDRLNYSTFEDFGEFSSPAQIEMYTRSIVGDVHDFDFEEIFELFEGRYRLYVTVLQMFLRDTDAGKATDYFLKKAWEICSLSGREFGINRSVWDDVVKFFQLPTFHPACFDLVVTLVLAWVYTGSPVRLAVRDSGLVFVQTAIGRLRRSDNFTLRFREGFDFFPVSEQTAAVGIETVTIGEPLVCRALLNYLTGEGYLQMRLLQDLGLCSQSRLGERFEPYSPQFLAGLLKDKVPADYVPLIYRENLSSVFRRPLSITNEQFVHRMAEEDDGSGFLSWLLMVETAWRSGRWESVWPCFHSSPVTSFGPDMIIVFRGTDSQGSHVPVFSLYQLKVISGVRMRMALNTLDIEDLFLHKKSKEGRSEKEEAAVTKFKGLLAAGGLMKWIVCVTGQAKDATENRVYDATYKEVPKVHRGKRTFEQLGSGNALVGILDRNVQMLGEETEWFFNAVQRHIK